MGHPGAERNKLLGELRLRKLELEGRLKAPSIDDMPSIFNEKEMETLQEVDRERRRGRALSDMGKNRTGQRVGATGQMGWKTQKPNDGSAGEANILDLPAEPPASALGSEVSRLLGALEKINVDKASGGEGGIQKPVTAELTGTASVEGKTEVEVKVTVSPSSELITAIANAKNSTAQMRGVLNSNGPGSTGKSSPDAAAPAPPISY